MVGGRRQVITVEPPAGLRTYMTEEIDARVEAIRTRRVTPSEDNMLKLSSDCRMASFDWEAFSGQAVDPAHSTLARCADEVAATYHATKDRTYASTTGATHPRPGSLQLVFADLGTPAKGDDAKAFHRFREMLVERGVPGDRVQFAHEHDANGAAKERFFDQCRDGRVAVAVSSRSKMGMGTNVQDRLVAMHHLDCPWRPSDIEQREGRILRQGNQNPEVAITAYATEASFSVCGWQTLERKAGFVGQVMRATPDGPRSVEVSDDEAFPTVRSRPWPPATLTSCAISARIGAGAPRTPGPSPWPRHGLRWSTRHRRHLRTSRARTQHRHRGTRRCPPRHPRPRTQLVPGDCGPRYRAPITNRADAARAIEAITVYKHMPVTVGRYVAEDLELRFEPAGARSGRYTLTDNNGTALHAFASATVADRHNVNEVVGALRKMDNAIARLLERVEDARQRCVQLVGQVDAARRTANTLFPHQGELTVARHDVATLQATLASRYTSTNPDRIGEPSCGPPATSGAKPPGPPIKRPPRAGWPPPDAAARAAGSRPRPKTVRTNSLILA